MTSLLAIGLLLSQDAVLAQRPRIPRGGQAQPKTKTVDATVKGMAAGRLLVEVDGQTGQIGLSRNTELVVTGSIERGLLRPGAAVQVNGYLREGGRLTDARVTVYLGNQSAARPMVRKVKKSDPLTTLRGRILSVDPLQMRCSDGISIVGEQVRANVPPPESRPAYNQILTIVPKGDGPLQANFGAARNMIREGDSAKITVPENGPRVATRVTVERSGTLTVDDVTGGKDDDE